ncbi:YcgN family cysteine cluster protein [Pseudoalteromonas fenneropenaei]|uniref:YcgN family cysteine cluster protein n=1 Tax=Pseudoalteromonas fenneropenaei TaxID=1737459 RepID=A0ABV7CIT4_9GAMM
MSFWLSKSLYEMNEQEWEAICDGCGKCCLHSFIDSDYEDDADAFTALRPGETLVFSNISCAYLDDSNCGCKDYANRLKNVPTCVKLSKENVEQAYFMPPSCAYRRLLEGRGLAAWHPLNNGGSRDKMIALGLTVKGRTVNEANVDFDDIEDYLVDWPTFDCE